VLPRILYQSVFGQEHLLKCEPQKLDEDWDLDILGSRHQVKKLLHLVGLKHRLEENSSFNLWELEKQFVSKP
jgi:hypothetical protein